MITRILLKCYLAYLAISLLVILPLLNTLPAQYVSQTYQRELQSEIILFNPFTLSLEARNTALPELDGEPFLGVSSLVVNLSLASLWSSGWVFDEIGVTGLYADIKQLKDGLFNFSDLVPADTADSPVPPDEESGIPGLTIEQLSFQADWLRFTDHSREKPFSSGLEGIEIAVTDFSTVLEEGKPYQIEARGEAGGELRWEGLVSVPGASSQGTLTVSSISLTPVSRFIEPWVRFELTDGRLDIRGDYDISWGGELRYTIDNGAIALKQLDIVPIDPDALVDTRIQLGQLTLDEIALNSVSERVNIKALTISGLSVDGWSEAEQVSLMDLFSPKNASQDTQRSQEQKQEQEDRQESQWSAVVAKTTLTQSELTWRSEWTSPQVLEVSPLELTAGTLNWPLEGESDFTLQLAVNEQANLALDGAINLADGDGKVNYTLEGLPVEWFNPNLPKSVVASINKGHANTNGTVTLSGFAPATLVADGDISDFSITVEERENAITGWDSVRWQQLAVDMDDKQLDLEAFFISGYSGRLHIMEDGTINTQKALMDESPPPDSTDEDSSSASPDWSFNIPSITITDSSIDFMDESLPITFRTIIGDLNGDISGISSDASKTASVDLLGSVDGYAPVNLSGTAVPFSTPPSVDLALTFDGVDLARLSPYSGTYAGYAIERGILNLDLNYTLADSHLDGNNQVIIAQMKLGEKIDSDKAVNLPIDLALGLLTDMNGVIDLSVPVSGNVDDPQFELGSVIASAFMNIITKAITAPFSLLASLVSSEEDLQRVTFSSGSTELDEAGKLKLMQLSEALQQRPGLTLIVSGRLHPRADIEYLQQASLRLSMLSNGLPESAWESKTQQWVDAIGRRYNALEDSVKAVNPPAGENGPSVRQMLQTLASTMVVPQVELETLAADRAVEVKRFLVNEAQLPAERSVIEAFDIDDEANLFSGVEMKIDS